MGCIRDDATECDCRRCLAAEDRFWDEQGGDRDDAFDVSDIDDAEDVNETAPRPRITVTGAQPRVDILTVSMPDGRRIELEVTDGESQSSIAKRLAEAINTMRGAPASEDDILW